MQLRYSAMPRLPWLPGLDIQGQFLGIGYVIADISDFSLQCTVVSPCTENALHSLWQLIAYKYVCAASQLFFFQQLVSVVGFSVYLTVDCRIGKRIVLIVSFAKCLISVKKLDGQMDGHRMMAYTACIALRGEIAILRTPAFIFCLPWGRPGGSHAKRCMNEKTIQCLPNPSQHNTHLS